ncbi:MAG TPA: PAS domain S-box protein [Candidatus Ozemobacteraceae bacterium]
MALDNGDQIVAVVAVGNKAEEYTAFDIDSLRLLMDAVWSIILRKKVEESLRLSQERFQAIFDHAGDAIFIRQGMHYMEANPKACQLLGYTRDELLQKTPFDITAPSAKLQVEKILAILPQTRHEVFETLFQHRNGTEIPVEVNITQIEFAGQFLSISMVRDITERKRAERELEESREKYRMLFTSMTNGFALHEIIRDDQGFPIDYRFIEVNPAYEQLTGLPAARIIGRPFSRVAPSTDLFWINTYARLAQPGESFTFEHYAPKIGRYYEISAFSTGDNKFVTIVSDITQRKLVECSLEESEEKFRALVENMTDVVLRIDPAFAITYVNTAVQAVFGIKDEELMGRPLQALPIPPDLTERIESHIRATLARKQASGAQFDLSNQAGARIIEWRSVPEFDDSHEVASVLNIIRDVTDRWLSEEALRDSEERFKVLARAAEEGIVFSRDGIIIDCNPRFLPMVGLEEMSQVIGTRLADHFSVRYQDEVTRRIATKSEEPYEAELVSASGRISCVRISAKHITYRGSVVRVSALQDLTEEKLASARLRESNERLHHLAAELESVREEEKSPSLPADPR